MDHPGEQQNTSMVLEALSSYLNNPRRTVIRIEAFVAVAAILLLLQLILGSCRRRSGHWFVQGALWLAYTLSFPIITYTLGQMMSSPVKTGLYPVWAVILLLISGCSNSVTSYDLDDNSKWRRYLFELLQHSFYLAIIFQLLYATHSVIPYINGAYDSNASQAPQHIIAFPFLFLFGVAIFDNLARVIAGRMVTNSSPTKVVVDYMRDQVDARGAQDSFDPVTMKGYKYIVRPVHQGEGSGTNRAAYRTQVRADTLITIDTIWDMDFGGTAHGGSRLKDACLSFALSHLLKRRFFGMECSEAALPETRRFVLQGLLSGEDGVPNYRRAFHIVEVELGFLYDSFTKYGVLFRMEKPFLVMAVLKLVFISIGGSFLLIAPPDVVTRDPVIEVGTREIDVTITVVVMGTLLLVQVLQAIFYLTSDWATVSLACSYPRRTTGKCVPSIIWFLGIFNLSRFRKSDKFLSGLNLFGYWQTKMGQSSVIEGCLHANLSSVLCSPVNYILNLLVSTMLTSKAFKPVPDQVKSEIVSCLQVVSRIGGPLTNGEAALERNGVTGELSWALANRNQTTTMLIWHIATEYCSTASLKEEEKLQRENYQKVAVTLSRYCAYLMYFVPDLLPGSATDTLFVFSCVKREVREMLRGRKPSRDRLLKVVTDSEGSINEGSRGNDHEDPDSSTNNNIEDTDPDSSTNNNTEDRTIIHISTGSNNEDSQDTIFVKGLKLGRGLEEKIQDDVIRWKVLAEFWAETIIYIAPSENVKAHMERLAQGGEFLTHVWALLNHAGILEREQKQTPEETV